MITSQLRSIALTLSLTFLSILFAASAPASISVQESDIWGAGTLSGTRSAANGLVGSGNWANPDFSVTWTVTAQSSGGWDWLYTYNIQDPGAKVSYAIIQVANSASSDDFKFVGQTSGQIGTYSAGPDYIGMPAGSSIFGIKFEGLEKTDGVFSFYTNINPEYGDFYASSETGKKKWGMAYNLGLNPAYEPEPGDPIPFVVTPSGEEVSGGSVPIPASFWLFGSALAIPLVIAKLMKI